MNSAVCTLFEGNYHLGVAGLTNSLYQNGFRGSIYVGYKGALPPWASLAKENSLLQWAGNKTLQVAEGLQLHFLPIETDYSLTNYKPDFMLKLWDGPAADMDSLFYFDPDIVILRSWLLFEEWANCGVAVSEDVNSPLAMQHPRRVAWRKYFGDKGISLNFKEGFYVNGGFIGLTKKNLQFLKTWINIQETMAPLIGGLNQSIFSRTPLTTLLKTAGGPFMPFFKTDQDALNAAIEACDQEISFIGKDGMGFENGFVIMHHAVGRMKPWAWKPFLQSWRGRPPRKIEIEFWNLMDGPVRAFPNKIVKRQKRALRICSAIGRIYKKQ